MADESDDEIEVVGGRTVWKDPKKAQKLFLRKRVDVPANETWASAHVEYFAYQDDSTRGESSWYAQLQPSVARSLREMGEPRATDALRDIADALLAAAERLDQPVKP